MSNVATKHNKNKKQVIQNWTEMFIKKYRPALKALAQK